ncbi:hypothetical protein BC332_33994 [Capsicum chinense]|nr:hypothetical protein BC332_33994 [Capsicum chinense]
MSARVTQTLVRIQCPENLRVPPQGSSTEGESGPKIRPKGVVDGQQASQKVMEACKGFLGPDEDWPSSAKAEGSLTARPTRQAGTKVDLSDPTVPSGRAIAQWIKVTLEITS